MTSWPFEKPVRVRKPERRHITAMQAMARAMRSPLLHNAAVTAAGSEMTSASHRQLLPPDFVGSEDDSASCGRSLTRCLQTD